MLSIPRVLLDYMLDAWKDLAFILYRNSVLQSLFQEGSGQQVVILVCKIVSSFVDNRFYWPWELEKSLLK